MFTDAFTYLSPSGSCTHPSNAHRIYLHSTTPLRRRSSFRGYSGKLAFHAWYGVATVGEVRGEESLVVEVKYVGDSDCIFRIWGKVNFLAPVRLDH